MIKNLQEVYPIKNILYGKYTKEFREEAVKLVTEGRLSLPGASRRFSLPKSTLESWVRTEKLLFEKITFIETVEEYKKLLPSNLTQDLLETAPKVSLV